jgi:hypothetical protein
MLPPTGIYDTVRLDIYSHVLGVSVEELKIE